MADGAGLLGGYKVGLISASLKPKGEEKQKTKEANTNSLLFTDSILQLKFKTVDKKTVKKNFEETTKEKVSHYKNQEDLKKKRKHSTKDDDQLETKKQKKLPLNKSADDDPERLARTIFVGNLPIATSRKELSKFFKKYGSVETTRLRSVAVPDFQTSKKLAIIRKQFNPNRSNLNGYVVFKNKESVEKALDCDGQVIGDLHIRVDRVGGEGKKYDHKRSIFVGNLIFDIKEEDLSSYFTVCGEVQSVRIIRDSATGIGKGFGYVLFKEASSVSLALKMNNSELCGRRIRVQPSQENPNVSTKGGMTKKGKTQEKFSGIQAKQNFYHKRKAQKLQKNSSLSSDKNNPPQVKKNPAKVKNKPLKVKKNSIKVKKNQSKVKKNNQRTIFKHKK